MTGIERLREFVAGINPITVVCGVTKTSYDREHMEVAMSRLRDFLSDIADQTERELREERDRWDEELCESQMDKSRATAVYLEMNKHLLGHEGMEDSPVARWARELREALGGDGRDHAADVSVSAYDLLPEEDRAPVLAADGEPLEVGQTVWDKNGDELVIGALEDGGHTVTCRYADVGDGIPVHGMWSPSDITHQRPVLDADGVEIRVGDTVYLLPGDWCDKFPLLRCHEWDAMKVLDLSPNNDTDRIECETSTGSVVCYPYPSQLTHRAPVLASDGEPLREGEHVWHVETGAELVVKKLPKPGEYQAVVVFALPTSPASHLTSFDPDQLTHERPEIDSLERIEEDAGCTGT